MTTPQRPSPLSALTRPSLAPRAPIRAQRLSLSCAIAVLVSSLIGLIGCDEENRPPQLLPLPELMWQLNRAQSLSVIATDPEGEPLSFTFELSPPPPTQTEAITGAPSLTPLNEQEALFTWTPGSADEGLYTLTFKVTDPRGASAEESVALSVREGSLGGAQLSFIEPIGAGVSVERDASGASCLRDLPIAVRADALPNAEVFVRLDSPTPEGATLWPSAELPGKERSLSWCPPPELLSAQERFTFRLYAYHRGAEGVESPGVAKQLLVRFQRQAAADCPGDPPVIRHQPPGELSGLSDYALDVSISDDQGVKSPPLVSYLVNPSQDPRLSPVSGWSLVEASAMSVEGLGRGESAWRATLPNLNLSEGEQATIYYRFLVTDNDDPTSARCDHSAESPIYELLVMGGGEGGSLSLCSPCAHSAQCGGVSDLCLSFEEGTFCGVSCAEAACPSGSTCYELSTSEGELVYQCLPLSGSCAQACTPDRFDQQDPLGEPTLSDGSYPNLSICDEEVDFYWLTLTPQGSLEVSLSFDDPSLDLDLALALEFEGDEPLYEYQSNQANTSSERLSLSCVGDAREALLAVYPYEFGEGSYRLEVSTSAQGCGVSCEADDYEGPEVASISADVITGLTICPNDVDRYAFDVLAEQVISLLVDVESLGGPLEARLYDPTGALIAERLERQEGALIETRARRSGEYMLEVKGSTALVSLAYALDLLVFEAQACASTQSCPAGTICDPALGCLSDECSTGWGCGMDHVCVSSDLYSGSSEGHCSELCYGRESCRAGEECKPLPSLERACISEGSAGLGEGCEAHSDCAESRACVVSVFGVGRCLDVACHQSLGCAAGERCLSEAGVSLCAPSCAQGACPGSLRCLDRGGERRCLP